MVSQLPVVLVTGASRGIGLATVQALLSELHANVVALSRSTNPNLEALQKTFPGRLIQVHGDLIQQQVSINAVTAARDQFGRLDGVILNAGVLAPTGTIATIPVESSDRDQGSWKSLFDVNFFSLVYTIQAALPLLRTRQDAGNGKIIFVSSGASVKGSHGWGPYSASKAAVNSLCRTLATEEKDIISIAIRPGVVDTDMQKDVRTATGLTQEDQEMFKKLHADKKLTDPNVTGYLLGKLALAAEIKLSGQYLDWAGEECAPYVRK